MSNPQISILIPTINREQCLQKTLFYIQEQTNVIFEVIVIYQSPLKNLNIAEYPNYFSFIKCNSESASAARNIGIKNSKSEILLFIDDDVVIKDTNFIYKHYRHYTDKNILGVVGSSHELISKPISFQRSSRSFNKHVGFLYFPKNYGSNTFVSSGRSNNLSVKKEIAIKVGGMDENYKRGAHREETDFCLRIRNKFGEFLYDPNAKLTHLNETSGGIRSWDDNDYIKAKHNITGAIYFDLKMAPFWHRIEYLFATLRYFILNKDILSRPQLYLLVIQRSISSFISAYRLYQSGYKYLDSKNIKLK